MDPVLRSLLDHRLRAGDLSDAAGLTETELRGHLAVARAFVGTVAEALQSRG
jgi:hypothetical protein